jgi:hypothetical protein
MDITISACVSKVAPGANEIVQFDRRMVSQVQGLRPQTSNETATGMVLEKQSVIKLRTPVSSREGYATTSLITKTRVNDIKIKQLPAQTFMPPKGYNKIEDQPPASSREDAQSIVLKQPLFHLMPFGFPIQSEI